MSELKLESLNYDVLSNIRSFLPSEDKNKVFSLNKKLNDIFTYDVIKEKNKKSNEEFKKFVVLLADALINKFSDEAQLKNINKILQNFFEFLDSTTLKNFSSQLHSLYDTIKSRFTNPEINYSKLLNFNSDLNQNQFYKEDVKALENLCQKLDQSENKEENDVVNLLFQLEKMNLIHTIDKHLGINRAEIKWYLTIYHVKRTLQEEKLSFESTLNFLNYIELKFSFPSHLSESQLKSNYEAGFFINDSCSKRIGIEIIISLMISVFIQPVMTLLALHMPPALVLLAITVCVFFIIEIFQQTRGLINMIKADKRQEEEAKMIKNNLCNFFKASNSDENDKQVFYSDDSYSNDYEMTLLIT